MRASSPARADSRMTGSPRVFSSAANRGEQAEAVEPRHHDVAQHQVGRIGLDALEGGSSVGDGFDAVPRRQQPADVVAHVGVVVRDEHARGYR